MEGFGRCAMVALGPRMGGDFVSTFKVPLMDHGEVPNIFPQTWKKGTRRLGAGGSQDRMGGERIGAGAREARGSRIGAGARYGSQWEELGAAEPIDWRASDLHTRGTVARGSELCGPQTWHADWRLDWLGVTRRGSELGACTMVARASERDRMGGTWESPGPDTESDRLRFAR